MVMSRDDLRLLREKLQSDKLELIEDIERRQGDLDRDGPAPVLVQREAPAVIYKTTDNGSAIDDSGGDDASSAGEPPSYDEVIDTCAEVICELRGELDARDAELRTEIAELRGQLSAVLALLGGSDGAKAISRVGARRLLKGSS